MRNLRIPLWAIAVCGLALVWFVYSYVTSQFQDATTAENEAYAMASYEQSPSASTSVTRNEQKRIDAWITHNNLNKFGDPQDKIYIDGEPLHAADGTIYTDKYQYIVAMHPEKPWTPKS